MSGELVKVAANVFAYLQRPGGWCVNNAGVVAGPDLTVVIDTAATEARARALRAAVATIAQAPVVLVNTHHHGDHTHGNAAFGPGTPILATAPARDEVRSRGAALASVWPAVDWGDLPTTPPNVTITGPTVLHSGSTTVELLPIGPAHTNNDLVAWLPAERVLFAGDLLLPGCTPFLLMGSVRGMLDAIEQLRAFAPDVVVGGHGVVSGPQVLDETERYVRWVDELADHGLAAGLGPLEVAAWSAHSPYRGLSEPERLVANLHRAYAERAGLPPGGHLPSAGPFADMVNLNGGPLRCDA